MYAWDITNILVGDNSSNEKIWENGQYEEQRLFPPAYVRYLAVALVGDGINCPGSEQP